MSPTFLKTLNIEKQAILAYFLNTALLILLFNLISETLSILYPACLSLIILAVFLTFKTIWLNHYSHNLRAAKIQADSLYAENYLEKITLSTIQEIHDSYGCKIASLSEQLDSRNALFSQFIHNMKSSVSIIGLACEKQPESAFNDISPENEKLEKNLEQALNILRLDEFSNDYVPERVDLSHIVKSVINDKRRDFIYAGVYPKFQGDSIWIYTDKKWCAFIIEQIVSNAIKYSSPEKNIYFDIQQTEEQAALQIRDEGVGILPEDLPRVTDLFYTGTNGRGNKDATGIGLSMVKHICKKLNHGVTIHSKAGTGTTVTLSFVTKM